MCQARIRGIKRKECFKYTPAQLVKIVEGYDNLIMTYAWYQGNLMAFAYNNPKNYPSVPKLPVKEGVSNKGVSEAVPPPKDRQGSLRQLYFKA